MPFALPAGLYLSRLCGAGYNVGGATYPGAPGMKFGHNARIAWGITNLVASPRDLYVETLDPADPARYRRDGGWAPFERRTETIAVRGEPAVDMEVRSTERGPVVDELVPRLPGSDGTALALGDNTSGQLGTGSDTAYLPAPSPLDPVPPGQANVLRAVKRGADVVLDFAGAPAVLWRVYRDGEKTSALFSR